MAVQGRALHWVFKVGDRGQTAKFYREILGMSVQRHEEFSEGCEATCNGAYAGRWSKTMIGYGPEHTHFVLELTYNYGIHSYEKGNDYKYITIASKEALERAKAANWPILPDNILEAPGGFQFKILSEPQPKDKDPVKQVTLSCSNILKTINFWNGILGLTIFNRTDKSVVLGFKETQVKLEFIDIGGPVNRGKAFGRIAYACPGKDQEQLAKKVEAQKVTIIHPLTRLPTPGKADVTVIILADPDSHEICFVDEEGFRQLSEYDAQGEVLLNRFIGKDKS